MNLNEQDVYAPAVPGTEHGLEYADRAFPHHTIPPDVHDVAERKRDVQDDHAALTRAGRKNHTVKKPESARYRSLAFIMTRKPSCNAPPSIDHLPNEILCAIFLLTGDPSPTSVFPRDRVMHPYELDRLKVQLYSKCAVILGKVCVRWRVVTRGYPPLWTIVDIDFPGREATSILKRCLMYSAGLPLTLWLSESLKIDDDRTIDMRFISLVAANAGRWTEISVELWRDFEPLLPLVALPLGSFKALRRARIYGWGPGAKASTSDNILWKSFCSSPNLDTVDWMEEQYIRTGLAEAPLRQLTRLGLHWIDPRTLSPFLETCTRLEELLISINTRAFGLDPECPLPIHSSLHLPHLRVLMLCGPADWKPLFSSLTAPALDRLDISRMDLQSCDIECMIRQSDARLRMLTVHWPAKGQGYSLVSLLRSSKMHHLRILRYERCYQDLWNLGWEDTFDLQPFVAKHVVFTESAAEAERYYAQIVSHAYI